MSKSFFELLYSTRTDIEFFVGGPGVNEKLKQNEPTWFYIESKVEIYSTKTDKPVPVMMEVLPQYNVMVVFYTNESTKGDELAIPVERGAIRRKFLVEIEAQSQSSIDKTDKQEPNQIQTLDVRSIVSTLNDSPIGLGYFRINMAVWMLMTLCHQLSKLIRTPTPTVHDSKTCEIHKKQLELLAILAMKRKKEKKKIKILKRIAAEILKYKMG